MNEPKVNTKIGDVTSASAKKNQDQKGRIYELESEYGFLVFDKRVDLLDHVQLRNRQMSAILMMTYGGNKPVFDNIDEGDRDYVLWMLHQCSKELEQGIRLLEGME